jgi:hypothetical protein
MFLFFGVFGLLGFTSHQHSFGQGDFPAFAGG